MVLLAIRPVTSSSRLRGFSLQVHRERSEGGRRGRLHGLKPLNDLSRGCVSVNFGQHLSFFPRPYSGVFCNFLLAAYATSDTRAGEERRRRAGLLASHSSCLLRLLIRAAFHLIARDVSLSRLFISALSPFALFHEVSLPPVNNGGGRRRRLEGRVLLKNLRGPPQPLHAICILYFVTPSPFSSLPPLQPGSVPPGILIEKYLPY